MLSACNQTLVRATDEAALLSDICRIAVEVGGYRLAWIGFAEQDEAKSVRPIACAGSGSEALKNWPFTWAEGLHGRGPTGLAIRTGQISVRNDSRIDPGYEPWRGRFAAFGVASSISLPLRQEDRVTGVLSLYSTTTGSFHEAEVRLLTELADDVAYGLASLRARAARAAAEDSLREKVALLEALLNSTLDGVLVVDSQDRKIVQNQRVSDLFKLPREIADDPDDRRQVEAVMQRIKNGALVGATIARLKTHPDEVAHAESELLDGTVLEVFSAPVLGPKGKRYGRIFTFRDVTDRARAAETQQRLQAILDNSSAAIYLKDLSGRFLLTNPVYDELFQPQGNAAVGKTTHELLPAAEAAQREAHDADVIAQGRPIMREETLERPDGRRFLLAQKFPLRDAAGKIVAVGGITTDITERKNLEAQFLQAQKMEAFGQLAGGIAHDFNNILAFMLINLGMMGGEPGLPPGMRSYLKDLESSARRASALVRQLLVFSRREAIRIRTMNLDQTLAEVTRLLRRFLGEQIQLELQHGPVPPWIEGDPAMIEQIVMNLCVNARDAMPRGGRLTIRTEIVDRGEAGGERSGRRVALTVTDTGCGMDAAAQERLFEPFFTTKGVGKGTGLGLATVYGIVKQHRGWIEVESAVGHGSTFRIFFPPVDPPAPSTGATEAPAMRGGSETLLFVEDEEAVRMATTAYLRRFGYRVIEAHNGPDAVRQWNEFRDQIDLVLTDMVMPEGMTGLELIETLLPSKRSLKTIILSGYNIEAEKIAAATRQGVVYLSKPIEPRVLLETIRQCLDRK